MKQQTKVNTMTKHTINIPINIECVNADKLRFNVYVDDTGIKVAEVELTHPGVNQFGAAVNNYIVGAGSVDRVEFSPEEFDDVDDAVRYFAGKFYAQQIFNLND